MEDRRPMDFDDRFKKKIKRKTPKLKQGQLFFMPDGSKVKKCPKGFKICLCDKKKPKCKKIKK